MRMKKLILATLAIMLVACAGETQESEKVYICTGHMSECYHETPDCRGLIRCSRDIEERTIEEAEEMGPRPCSFCYR